MAKQKVYTTKDIAVLDDQIRKLAETLESARPITAVNGTSVSSGNFTSQRSATSLPNMGNGTTTFHFAHKRITEGARKISSSNGLKPQSAASTKVEANIVGLQDYIVRPHAVENCDTMEKIIEEVFGHNDDVLFDERPGFECPGLSFEPDRASFDTIGATPAERLRFWEEVGNSEKGGEKRGGHVQYRIIASLPHELGSAEERLKVVAEFCRSILLVRGLPFWAVVHVPSKKSDRMNFHIRIAYYDRPASIHTASGKLDIALSEARRTDTKGQLYTAKKPYKQNKDRLFNHRTWIKALRVFYADVANDVLVEKGHAPRFNPKSYEEAGVAKTPTRPLGPAASAVVRSGGTTDSSEYNTQAEAAFKAR